jgi:hypothetical protein
MTVLIIVLVCVGLVVAAFAASLFGGARERPGDRPAPTPPMATAHGTPLAYCADCGRLVAVHKGDGLPYRNKHTCRIAPPAETEVA